MNNKMPRRITSDMLFDSNFTDLFNVFNKAPAFGIGESLPSYPHFNVSSIYGDRFYDVEVSLAGFTKDEISVQFEPYRKHSNTNLKVLQVDATRENKQEDDGKNYIYENIAKRNARLSLLVGQDDEVDACTYKDGILYITLAKPSKYTSNDVEKIDIE